MRYTVLLVLFSVVFVHGQDAYHQGLLDNMSNVYGIEGGVFLFGNTEQDLAANSYQYGSMTVTDKTVENMDFSLSKNILVTSAGNNAWDAGMGQEIKVSISEEDLILITFWAKRNSGDSQIFVFAEEATSFDKEFYFPLKLTPDWNQYYIAFHSSRNFNIGRLKAGFHLASMAQDIDLAGFTAINYEDNYEIEDLPSSFSPFNYEGSEEDAPWRALAESRIESLRKADLTVNVVDGDGDPIANATVAIEMQKHEFGFGSALVTCRVPGNNCYDATYVEKLLDLDGEGHRFNVGVNENALKWRAWENNWLGTPQQTVDAFRWFSDNGITMRGHNILWPGSDYLPDDINSNLGDIDYLRNRIDERIEEMINHPELKEIVRDWDVLNEITTNRTLENAFNNDASLDNGRKVYGEIYRKINELDPDLELYINDYMVISSGSANQIARYKSFLDELLVDDVPFDGIGFQCHIGSIPNSIPQVEQHFNDFYQRYGKRMKVTEYDVNNAVDEGIQASYMRDFLTLTFSHPGMDAFIMWGFWDGNHWKNNAPMFYQDWSLKPSGQAFLDKVYNDWWTSELDTSNTAGQTTFRPFKGEHKITVTKDSETVEVDVVIGGNETIEVVLGDLDATTDLDSSEFVLSPNPVIDGTISLKFPNKYSSVDIAIYSSSGKRVMHKKNISSGEIQNLSFASGTYTLEIKTPSGSHSRTFIIL